MISLRWRLLLLIGLILMITQLISVFWVWHESQEQISILVDATLQARERSAMIEHEVDETIAALLLPVLCMLGITLGLVLWAVTWVTRPLAALSRQLETRSIYNLSPLTLSGQAQEVVAVVNTLNSLFLRLEQAIEHERLFTADVAHELRTPLAGLRLHLELLREQGTAGAAPLVNRIDQMILTIEQLLLLARTGQRFIKGDYHRVDLVAEVLAPMQLDTADYTGEFPTRLRWAIPAHAEVMGDASLLQLLLRNLLENAARYADTNGETLVTLRQLPDGIWELLVSDEGPGVDAGDLPRMTEPFRRLDQSGHSSGLGLNIVARIAYLHQAQLTVSNREDRPGLMVSLRFTLLADQPVESTIERA